MINNSKKICRVFFLSIFNVSYGFLFFYFLPTLLLFAFNRSKGDAYNNPDGLIFIIPAWIILILSIICPLYINFYNIKKLNTKKHLIIVVVIAVIALIIGATVGIIKTNETYYVNYTNILKELGL